MKRLALLLLFALSFALPCAATTYFISPAGSDSNNGTSSGTPWLTPNHAVNCGDTITAAAGTYVYSNFNANFGTVTCTGGNNVAWLTCATFDACKISGGGSGGIWVQTNYWGVQGWEITNASPTAATSSCFRASPTSAATIHHIIFANDIANGCGANGFTTFPYYAGGQFGVDYIAIVGDIAYNAAQSNSECYSGISIYEPVNSDTLPGTHIYVAGNYGWANLDPNPCGGGAPTDGEGIILDTFDGSQSSFATPYTGQTVAANNIMVFNGGSGWEVFNNQTGTTNAPIYMYANTAFGNKTDPNETVTFCGDSYIDSAKNVNEYGNIVRTGAATACGSSSPLYAYWISRSNSTIRLHNNWGYSAAGNNIGTNSNTGFVAGPNVFGTDPAFANPVMPAAPSCGSSTSVPNCVATLIANFTPTVSAAKSYGYQIPATGSVYDPLFPQWLCNVNLPAGLVSMGCLPGAGTTAVGGAQITSGVKIL
jgi:hypothetical protein